MHDLKCKPEKCVSDYIHNWCINLAFCEVTSALIASVTSRNLKPSWQEKGDGVFGNKERIL
jgi:hypothetical protein